MTFRTTFRDTRSSRQIALIDLPCPKNARRIFAIVSTISIPTSAPIIMEASVDPQPPGSRLDADHPENGVLIPRRNTLKGTASVRAQPFRLGFILGHRTCLKSDKCIEI